FMSFAQTARRQSFAAAARDLGTSPSAVAKSVARLEERLGVKLFHRTTRKVSLTPDGERLFQRCERVLAEVEDLEAEAAGVRETATGTLRIDAPLVYGRTFVMPLLVRLAAEHPGLELDVRLQDAYADLVQGGLDMAIRVGKLKDSTLVAKRIDTQQLIFVASPRYLKAHGVPRTPDQLATHSGVVFRQPSTGRARAWQVRSGRRTIEMHPAALIQVNDGEAMAVAAAEGLGIAQVPDYMASQAMREGRLVEVMKDHRPAPMDVSVVVPSAKLMPIRVRLAIQALEALGKRSR
ncbi:MAG TPA: LysR family transcriptional regulator, partial [Aquabacterium sp.]|nr:LysR family transcriptional regulator [Aquabacterium sp.]